MITRWRALPLDAKVVATACIPSREVILAEADAQEGCNKELIGGKGAWEMRDMLDTIVICIILYLTQGGLPLLQPQECHGHLSDEVATIKNRIKAKLIVAKLGGMLGNPILSGL